MPSPLTQTGGPGARPGRFDPPLRIGLGFAPHSGRAAGGVRDPESEANSRDRRGFPPARPLASESRYCALIRPFSGIDIIQRRFWPIRHGLYAAAAYVERCGDPRASGDGSGYLW